MPVDGAVKDYIKISYAGADTLYVPATQLDLVSKYIGAGEDRPVKLSKMGGTEWARTKTRAKAAAKSMAKELTALYAARTKETTLRFAVTGDRHHGSLYHHGAALHAFYDFCKREGVKEVYDAGDLLDGHKVYKG